MTRATWIVFFVTACSGRGKQPTPPSEPQGPADPVKPAEYDAAPDATPSLSSVANRLNTPPSEWPVHCGDDTDCDWDNACVPSRCGERHRDRQSAPCEESAPPPGECACVDRVCALRPKVKGSSAVESCNVDNDCAFDAGVAQCFAMAGNSPSARRPVYKEGGYCTCAQGKCQMQWVEKIACKSWRDCDIAREPVAHPVRANPPLQRQLQACKDGSIVPACNRDGYCELFAAGC